jgi:poly(3-hydroxybutyrate) depolymerase
MHLSFSNKPIIEHETRTLSMRTLIMKHGMLFAIVIASCANSGFAAAPAGWEARISGTTPYQLFKPANYDTAKRYPLVAVFHGAGGRGTANDRYGEQECIALTKDSIKTKYPCFIIAPQCPTTAQWVNVPFNQGLYSTTQTPISDQLKDVYNAIIILSKELPVDKNRLYLMGGSMGAYAQWDLLARYPNTFAASIPASGGGDTSKAKVMANVPIHAFHSTDDGAVPFSGSVNLINAIRKAGGHPLFDTLVNMGHIWQFTIIDSVNVARHKQTLINWLFLQSLPTTSIAEHMNRPYGNMARDIRQVVVGSRNVNGGLAPDTRYTIVRCDGKMIARCKGTELNGFLNRAPKGIYLIIDNIK